MKHQRKLNIVQCAEENYNHLVKEGALEKSRALSFFRVENNFSNGKITNFKGGNYIMILFTILFIILVILAILTVLGVAALGVAGIVVFGDVIACVVIITLVIRHFIKKRQ